MTSLLPVCCSRDCPRFSDWLMVGEGDEASLCARVIKRQGDRGSMQIQLGAENAAVA